MYTAPTTITFRLNVYQQFELASCACDEPTSFFAVGFRLSSFFYVSELDSPITSSYAYTLRHTRPVRVNIALVATTAI
jgi:hypothetical protein